MGLEWLLGGVLFLMLLFWLTTRHLLKVDNLAHHEEPVEPPVYLRAKPSEGYHQAVGTLVNMNKAVKANGRRNRLRTLRQEMDNLGLDKEGDCQLIKGIADGVPGEWTLAPGAHVERRVLYFHGGAFMMGSPKSHRAITHQLSKRLNAAVFTPDYRLMPEHKRMDCFTDCQTAYRWILENGPAGKTELHELVIAGDSAGGCLTLTTIAWARDENLRTADAAIALSPITDLTFSGRSMTTNATSDLMLKSLLGRVHKIPKPLILWMSWISAKIRPNNPIVSPILGDLSGLPPVLIQASDSEMLLSDARRYANKARAEGANIKLQTWPHMLHVWQIFSPDLEEAEEAFTEIACFVEAIRNPDNGVNSL